MHTAMIWAALAALALPLGAGAQTDDVAQRLDEAKRAHAAALKKAKEALLAQFDKTADAARAGNLATDKKLAALDALKKERAAFEQTAAAPAGPAMKTAAADYRRAADAALDLLNAEFIKAVEAYTKAKDDARATVTERERKAAVIGDGFELVGEWQMDGKNSEGMVERWTIAKVKGQWSVAGRYFAGAGNRALGQCVGRDCQFAKGALSCTQVFTVKPNQKWGNGTVLTFTPESADPERLTFTFEYNNKKGDARFVRP